MDPMQNLDLDDLLRERLGPEIFERFAKVRAYHFWLWKTHRVCDDNSLRGQRFYLYNAGVLTLAPHSQLVRRRPFHDYAASLGIHLDQYGRRSPFAGDRFPGVDLRRDVSEPGDGERLYEEATLGWMIGGYGATLGYSLETTLTNCLREPVRWARRGRCKSYLYPDFNSTLKGLEIWSVVDALDQLASPGKQHDEPDPAEALLSAVGGDGAMPASSLPLARAYSQARLDRSVARNAEGELSLFMVMLGFLVDELLARIAAPNGMGFGYRGTAAQLEALLSEFDGIFVPARMLRADADGLRARLDSLVKDCRAFESTSEKQAAEDDWISQCRQTADRLRDFGFSGRASRTLGDAHADLVFSASNQLWRWIFFLDQRQAIDDLHPSPSAKARATASDILWSWLQRPWGIVTVADIAHAFRGLAPGDENDEMPRAFSALTPMLKSSVVEYLSGRFGLSADQAQGAVRHLIDRRYGLYLVRRLTREVVIGRGAKEDGLVDTAHTLIAAFSRWLFQGQNEALPTLQRDLAELPAMLSSGDWLPEHLAASGSESSLLSRTEAESLAPYLLNPAQFSADAFLFDEPDFDVAQQVGLFPLEFFRFVSPHAAGSNTPGARPAGR